MFIGVAKEMRPETRKPAQGGLLEVFRRLSETGLDYCLVGRGNLKQVGIYLFYWLIIYWSTCLEYQLERCVVWIPMDGAF